MFFIKNCHFMYDIFYVLIFFIGQSGLYVCYWCFWWFFINFDVLCKNCHFYDNFTVFDDFYVISRSYYLLIVVWCFCWVLLVFIFMFLFVFDGLDGGSSCQWRLCFEYSRFILLWEIFVISLMFLLILMFLFNAGQRCRFS